MKTVFRQKAAYTKQSHEELADRLVERANVFITEEMDFRALQYIRHRKERWDTAVCQEIQKEETLRFFHKGQGTGHVPGDPEA